MILLNSIAGLMGAGILDRFKQPQKNPAQEPSSIPNFEKNLLKNVKILHNISGNAIPPTQTQDTHWLALLNHPDVKIPLENAGLSKENIQLFRLPGGKLFIGDPSGHKLDLATIPEAQQHAEAILRDLGIF